MLLRKESPRTTPALADEIGGPMKLLTHEIA
jgi:hypothetical protein